MRLCIFVLYKLPTKDSLYEIPTEDRLKVTAAFLQATETYLLLWLFRKDA